MIPNATIIHSIAVFPARILISFILFIFSFSVAYRSGHHRDNGMSTDPYFKAEVNQSITVWLIQWLRGALLLLFWAIRPYIGVLALVWPSLRHQYAVLFLQDSSRKDLSNHPEVLTCARAEWGQLLYQLPLWWCFFNDVTGVIYGFIIPMWITGLLASYRLLCEHHYIPVTDRRIETILATTHDHHLSCWSRIFLAPKNIGFHIVHHIHPQVGWRHLPNIRIWYIQRLGEAYPQTKLRTQER